MATTSPPPTSFRTSSSIGSASTSRRRRKAAAAATFVSLLLAQGASALELTASGDGRRAGAHRCYRSGQHQGSQKCLHRKRQRLFSSSSASQLSLSRAPSSSSSSSGPYGGSGAACGPSSPSVAATTDVANALSSIPSSQLNPVDSVSPWTASASATTALKQRDRSLLVNRRGGGASRRRTTAPLVDSDLLRFLGRQKQLLNKQQQVHDDVLPRYRDGSMPYGGSNGDVGNAGLDVDADVAATTNSAISAVKGIDDDEGSVRVSTDGYLSTNGDWKISELSQVSLSVLDGSTEEPLLDTSAAAAPPATTVSSDSSCLATSSDDLGPFQSDRLAQSLLSRDQALDQQLAMRAGDAVHAEALRRASRRQIRAFLKARDRQWLFADTRRQTTENLADILSNEESIAAPNDPMTESSTFWSSNKGQFHETMELLMAHNATHPYGLTGRDICEILVHTPSVALMQPCRSCDDDDSSINSLVTHRRSSSGGETLQETLDRVMALLTRTLKLRRYDVRKVLRSCPGLLTQRGSRNAAQMVTMLTESLSVTANSLARDKTGLPTLLRRSPASLFRLVAFLASDAVRMPVSQIGPLVRQPKSQELLNAVVPVWSSSSTAAVAMDDESPSLDFDADSCYDSEAESFEYGTQPPPDTSSDSTSWTNRRLLIQERRNAVNALYQNMTCTAWTLRNEVGTADLGKVIAAYPSVLLLDAESQVLEVAKFLMNDLGIWKDDLARVLQLYPVLLGMDVNKMREVANYLSEDLDVSPDSVAIIFRSFPKLLALSVEDDMKPVVDFLQTEIGIANVGRFISRLPPVLGYSVDRELRPKWKFLTRMFVDARFEVTRFPAYFSYPLERVIKSRFEYLRTVKRIPTPLVSLDQVLRYGDRDFSTKVARDNDHGQSYSRFVQERQKRSASGTSTSAMTTAMDATDTAAVAPAPSSSAGAPIAYSSRRPKSFTPVSQQQRP